LDDSLIRGVLTTISKFLTIMKGLVNHSMKAMKIMQAFGHKKLNTHLNHHELIVNGTQMDLLT
jgi:hypothetical protein